MEHAVYRDGVFYLSCFFDLLATCLTDTLELLVLVRTKHNAYQVLKLPPAERSLLCQLLPVLRAGRSTRDLRMPSLRNGAADRDSQEVQVQRAEVQEAADGARQTLHEAAQGLLLAANTTSASAPCDGIAPAVSEGDLDAVTEPAAATSEKALRQRDSHAGKAAAAGAPHARIPEITAVSEEDGEAAAEQASAVPRRPSSNSKLHPRIGSSRPCSRSSQRLLVGAVDGSEPSGSRLSQWRNSPSRLRSGGSRASEGIGHGKAVADKDRWGKLP